jgi:hypothetical protein
MGTGNLRVKEMDTTQPPAVAKVMVMVITTIIIAVVDQEVRPM